MSALFDRAPEIGAGITQIPVNYYFDNSILAKEKKLIFDVSANYQGSQLMVANHCDYYVLPASHNGKMLVNNHGGFLNMSNICRHRQALILEGNGQLTNDLIVCPIHRWTYKIGNNPGELIGAPHFPDNPCLNLHSSTLENWQGLLFAGPRSAKNDFINLQAADFFKLNNYKLDRVHLHHCKYNWKTFIEVYLEDYHVEPFHPGLGNFVQCDNLKWQFDNWYSVQKVGITNLQKAGSKVYQRWQEELNAYNNNTGQTANFGAIWLTYYPNIMLEWYPHVLVVSTLFPQSPTETLNIVEFYYPEEIVDFERGFVEAQQEAYLETTVEDDIIAEKMDYGRYALKQQGRNEFGPYQSPMEDGMQHFHQFYRNIMKEELC